MYSKGQKIINNYTNRFRGKIGEFRRFWKDKNGNRILVVLSEGKERYWMEKHCTLISQADMTLDIPKFPEIPLNPGFWIIPKQEKRPKGISKI